MSISFDGSLTFETLNMLSGYEILELYENFIVHKTHKFQSRVIQFDLMKLFCVYEEKENNKLDTIKTSRSIQRGAEVDLINIVQSNQHNIYLFLYTAI